VGYCGSSWGCRGLSWAAVVLAHTAAELHSTVSRRHHHDHLVSAGTAGLKRLPLTVVHRFCTVQYTRGDELFQTI